jgi:hypothetical protein
LYAVNFMADMQAGMGSHLGMLLQGCGWTTGAIGTVSTMGAIAGMVAMTRAGAVVDVTTASGVCDIAVDRQVADLPPANVVQANEA